MRLRKGRGSVLGKPRLPASPKGARAPSCKLHLCRSETHLEHVQSWVLLTRSLQLNLLFK